MTAGFENLYKYIITTTIYVSAENKDLVLLFFYYNYKNCAETRRSVVASLVTSSLNNLSIPLHKTENAKAQQCLPPFNIT